MKARYNLITALSSTEANVSKSGLRKIKDAPKPCMHPEHNPPSMIVLDPGTYEYSCPSCGKTVIFTVPLITCAC